MLHALHTLVAILGTTLSLERQHAPLVQQELWRGTQATLSALLVHLANTTHIITSSVITAVITTTMAITMRVVITASTVVPILAGHVLVVRLVRPYQLVKRVMQGTSALIQIVTHALLENTRCQGVVLVTPAHLARTQMLVVVPVHLVHQERTRSIPGQQRVQLVPQDLPHQLNLRTASPVQQELLDSNVPNAHLVTIRQSLEHLHVLLVLLELHQILAILNVLSFAHLENITIALLDRSILTIAIVSHVL